jgi:Holliday junction resolvasome RuvABC endonuclease subunit
MNNTLTTLLEILKYTLPAIIVLIACSSIVKKFLLNDFKEKHLSLLKDNQDTTVRLRLQAYERLTLYIERIHPRNLIPRVFESGMNVAQLQAMLIVNIKTEFEHNISQQVYVTKQVWNAVRGAKEQEMNMIHMICQKLDPEASGKELHRKITEYILSVEGDLPSDVALKLINEEARIVLSYGSQA